LKEEVKNKYNLNNHIMKNLSKSHVFILLISISLFTSCKKLGIDKEPAALADKLTGNYSMSEIIASGQTIPLPFKNGSDEFNGSIEVKKAAANEIDMIFTFNTIIKGVKETDTSEDTFYLKQGEKDIELFDDEAFNKQIGSIVGGKTLYIVSGDTDRITAIKK
jgi:hypothetical protein